MATALAVESVAALSRWTLLVVAVMLQMKLHTLLAIVEVTRLVLGEIDR